MVMALLLVCAWTCLFVAVPGRATAKVGYGDAYTDCVLRNPSSWAQIRAPSGVPAYDSIPGVREVQELRFSVELVYADANSFQWESAGRTGYLATTVAEDGWITKKKKRKRRRKKRRRVFVPGQKSTANWAIADGTTRKWGFEWSTTFDVAVHALVLLEWWQAGKQVHSEWSQIPSLNYPQYGGYRARGENCYLYNPYGTGTGEPRPYGGKLVYFD